MVMALVDGIYAGPLVWGVSDCCTRACDVFAALHGVDPMAPLRGRYAGPVEALRVIASRGGWLRMVDDLCIAAGLQRGATGPGALGLVRRGGWHALAIGVPGGWCAPAAGGGSVILPDAVASWGMPDG